MDKGSSRAESWRLLEAEETDSALDADPDGSRAQPASAGRQNRGTLWAARVGPIRSVSRKRRPGTKTGRFRRRASFKFKFSPPPGMDNGQSTLPLSLSLNQGESIMLLE